MRQLREHVKQGCQMAEEVLTPASACHHALPLIIMEHSSVLPEQAAMWQAIAQVRCSLPKRSRDPHQDGSYPCWTPHQL